MGKNFLSRRLKQGYYVHEKSQPASSQLCLVTKIMINTINITINYAVRGFQEFYEGGTRPLPSVRNR